VTGWPEFKQHSSILRLFDVRGKEDLRSAGGERISVRKYRWRSDLIGLRVGQHPVRVTEGLYLSCVTKAPEGTRVHKDVLHAFSGALHGCILK
jgi:hypothetical protein